MKKLLTLLSFIIITTAAMAADKYISSSGDLVLKTATGKGVNLNNGLYSKQDGTVGIGTLVPLGRLHVAAGSSFTDTAIMERNVTTTNTVGSALRVLQTTTADMIDGFGAGLALGVKDSAGVYNTLAQVIGVRNGSDDSGDLALWTNNAGSQSEKMIIKKDGKVGIGTTSPSTYAVKFDIYNPATSGPSWSQVLTFGAAAERLLKIGLDSGNNVGFQAMKNDDSVARSLSINAAGGNVGIGITNPSRLLTLQSANANYPGLLIRGTEDGSDMGLLIYKPAATDYQILNRLNGSITLGTNDNGRLVIAADGTFTVATTYGVIRQGINGTAGRNAGTYKTTIASGSGTACDAQCASDDSSAGFNGSSGRCLGAWFWDGTWRGCSDTGTADGKTCLCMGTY